MGSLDWADVLADEPVPPPPRSMHELLEQTRRRGQERLGRRNRRRRGVLTALAVASIVTPLLVLVGDSSTRVSTRVARLPSVTTPAPIAPAPADNGLGRSPEPGGPAASGTGQLPIDGLGAGSPASVPSVLGNATGPPNPGPAGPSSDPLTALPAVAFMRQSCPGGQEQSQLLLRRPSGATNAMPPAPDRRSTQASWSPDGHRVVFASQRNNLIWLSHSVWDLYVMNADGSGLRQITFSPQNPADQLTGTSSPAWSSDGWIYYTQATTGKAPLRAIRPDGSGDRVVLASPTADYFNPTVSPDGTEIAVDEVARPSDNTIVVINPSGKVLFRLAGNGLIDGPGMSFTPDGRSLVYSRFDGPGRNTPRSIVIVGLDGSAPRVLLSSGGAALLDPRVLPGGVLIYVVGPANLQPGVCPNGRATTAVWALDLATGHRVQLTDPGPGVEDILPSPQPR